tara:strand:- start:185 stop:382 length:198 start_codon:yes stop_codon:yes gene_type:complete
MQNKIKALTNIVNVLLQENTQLKDLAVGTLETLKLMKGYDKAIEKLKESIINKKEEDGVIKSDTK